jgi:hypothetical protein
MLNAEYPDPISSSMVRELRDLISQLGLKDQVEFRSDFLPDAEAAALLSQADLLVFAYQDTQESASGAVRHGMATGRPVMVTPVPIFEELGGAVFRASGRDAEALADGIAATLRAQREGSEQARAVEVQATAWRSALDVRLLSRRLLDIARGLHPIQAGHDTPRHLKLPGSSRMLRSEVGRPSLTQLRTQGKAGHLLFGPYLGLPPGHYLATLQWRAHVPDSAKASLRIAVAGGTLELAQYVLADTHGRVIQTTFAFELDQPCSDLELQVQVDAQVNAEITSIAVSPDASLRNAAPADQMSGTAGAAPHALA